MSDPMSLFDAAELSLASYSTLAAGSTADQRAALTAATGAEMSLAQATAFASRYPIVVTSFSDANSGFQVTVFKDPVGNLKVAFRGTTIDEDLPTGADIVGSGAGYNQIVAMATGGRGPPRPTVKRCNSFGLRPIRRERSPPVRSYCARMANRFLCWRRRQTRARSLAAKISART